MGEESEDDIYNETNIEEALEGDEVDDLEEGFMKGYDDDGVSLCPVCKKMIDDFDDVVEVEKGSKTIILCSEKCATRFRRKHNL